MGPDSLRALDPVAPAARCRSCEVVRMAAGESSRGDETYVLEAADEDTVVISGSRIQGLIIVPRQHISGLGELSPASSSRLLAAVRRAARSLEEMTSAATSRVAVLMDSPASAEHVCFHVTSRGPSAPSPAAPL